VGQFSISANSGGEEASDPAKLGWMVGSPPPADDQRFTRPGRPGPIDFCTA
jgi:hypothetical protein